MSHSLITRHTRCHDYHVIRFNEVPPQTFSTQITLLFSHSGLRTINSHSSFPTILQNFYPCRYTTKVEITTYPLVRRIKTKSLAVYIWSYPKVCHASYGISSMAEFRQGCVELCNSHYRKYPCSEDPSILSYVFLSGAALYFIVPVAWISSVRRNDSISLNTRHLPVWICVSGPSRGPLIRFWYYPAAQIQLFCRSIPWRWMHLFWALVRICVGGSRQGPPTCFWYFPVAQILLSCRSLFSQ